MEIRCIPTLFGLPEAEKLTELNRGHINRTFLADCGGERYVLQGLNRSVFPCPEAVMDNIAVISEAFGKAGDIGVTVPCFIACGDKTYAAAEKKVWRIYRYLSATATAADKPAAAGLAFGTFIRVMEGRKLSPAALPKGYHDFGSYYMELAALDGRAPRLEELKKELDAVFTEELPRRMIHGDAKTDNVLIGEALTVIDLDTVMESYAAIDFGDLVRSVCKNDMSDLSPVRAAAQGFAEGLDGLLTAEEVNSLYYGILRSTGELAVRYLADSLREEKYFRGKTTEDCIARAEELMAQLEAFIAARAELTEIISDSFGSSRLAISDLL